MGGIYIHFYVPVLMCGHGLPALLIIQWEAPLETMTQTFKYCFVPWLTQHTDSLPGKLPRTLLPAASHPTTGELVIPGVTSQTQTDAAMGATGQKADAKGGCEKSPSRSWKGFRAITSGSISSTCTPLLRPSRGCGCHELQMLMSTNNTPNPSEPFQTLPNPSKPLQTPPSGRGAAVTLLRLKCSQPGWVGAC